MKRISVLTMVMLFLTIMGKSQTTEQFKPSGNPFMRIYSNYHTTFSNGESTSAFELTRVYLGYEYQFSKNFSAKANIDVGNPDDGGDFEYTAFIKNAYVKYKQDNWTVNFGMISTTQFKVQENFWGYRYLEKSFQDGYSFNSSADMGISVAYKFSDFISADLIIANGEGYKKVEADSTLRTGFGVTVNPVQKLTARVYYDFSSNESTQTSLATFLGYADDHFSLGAEYNYMTNYKFVEGRDRSGTSFYATVFAAPKVKLFARYDNVMSNTLSGASTDWNLSKDGELFLAGVEYAPVKGIKLTPTFSGWKPADSAEPFSSTLLLNCEFKF